MDSGRLEVIFSYVSAFYLYPLSAWKYKCLHCWWRKVTWKYKRKKEFEYSQNSWCTQHCYYSNSRLNSRLERLSPWILFLFYWSVTLNISFQSHWSCFWTHFFLRIWWSASETICAVRRLKELLSIARCVGGDPLSPVPMMTYVSLSERSQTRG